MTTMPVYNSIHVTLEHHGRTVIHPDDHKATGGEATIFVVGDKVIKLYLDPAKMVRDDMQGKIQALSALQHPFIVVPKGLVFTPSGDPVGFYMNLVDGEPLPRVFTGTFWKDHRFTYDHASRLVFGMQEVVRFAHQADAVLCDPNEMNWFLVWDKNGNPEPRIIDVDSWSIGKWHGKPIMLSIRDWHSKGFSKMTDWFAWGVVTFQVYAGIHPYKGTAPGFRRGDLEGRMKANVSVFAPGIGLNTAVRDFSHIPGPLLDWYVAVFQNGVRSIPPSPFEKAKPIVAVTKTAVPGMTEQETLIFEKILETVGDPIVRIFPCGVVLLMSGLLIDLEQNIPLGKARTLQCHVVRAHNGWIKAEWEHHQAFFSYIDQSSLQEKHFSLNVKSRGIVSYENRLFLITEQGLSEVMCHKFADLVLSIGQTWGAMVHATKWFDGVGIQDALGASFLIVPFGQTGCVQIRVKELDGLRPVAAKAGHRFVSVIAADRHGLYHKLEFTLNANYTTYTLWKGGTDSSELNVVILPKGVCATIVDDGVLDIFVPTQGSANKVRDRRITSDVALFRWNNTVVGAQGTTAWKIRMT